MMADRKDQWTTVSVSILPTGWRNVFADDTQKFGVFLMPCAAVLLQENRSTDVHELHTNKLIRHETHTAPYATQTVFAEHSYGCLWNAADTGNYLGTIGPDELVDETLKDRLS